MELYYLLCGAVLGATIVVALWVIGDSASDDCSRYGERKDDVDDGR